MRASLWSLVLCAGVCVAAAAAPRSVEVERAPASERATPAAACVSATAGATDAATDAAAPLCGKCGDGYCNPRCGETATSCPRDCGTPSS